MSHVDTRSFESSSPRKQGPSAPELPSEFPARQRAEILAEATAALASSLGYDETLERVAQLAVPVLADWCVVDLVDDDGPLRRVSVAHRDPGKLELVRAWACRFPAGWGPSQGVPEVIRTGEPELVTDIPDELLVGASRDPADLEALRALGLASYLIVPLVARDRRLGALTLVSAESGRRYGAADVELARELARRAALAVDNARLYAEAQRAAHAREHLLAIVSHDLRNPLTSIGLFASLLRAGARDPHAAKQLESILGAVDRMKRLIGDLLDTSAIQNGHLALARAATDPAALIAEAVEAQRALADAKQIALAHEARAGRAVDCDPGRIAQVLGNLIGNAIKFCRPGDSIRVTLDEEQGHARLVVADTGPGIAAHDLPHIFEPYWTTQGDASKGSGLGLYICKGIVEAHGGRIRADSRPGQDTRLSFTLPLAAPPAPPP